MELHRLSRICDHVFRCHCIGDINGWEAKSYSLLSFMSNAHTHLQFPSASTSPSPCAFWESEAYISSNMCCRCDFFRLIPIGDNNTRRSVFLRHVCLCTDLSMHVPPDNDKFAAIASNEDGVLINGEAVVSSDLHTVLPDHPNSNFTPLIWGPFLLAESASFYLALVKAWTFFRLPSLKRQNGVIHVLIRDNILYYLL